MYGNLIFVVLQPNIHRQTFNALWLFSEIPKRLHRHSRTSFTKKSPCGGRLPRFNEQPVTQEYRYSRCPHSIRELLSVARSMFTLAESRSSTMITQSESETEPGSILFPLPLHDPENYKDASLALPNNPIVSFKAVDQQVSRQTEGVFRIDTKLSAAHKTFHKHPYLTRSINI